MEARFISTEPHTTLVLEIAFNATTELPDLEQLTALLSPLGWVREDAFMRPAPPPNGTAEVIFYKPGTDVVGGWTPDERRTNMPQVRKALRQFGFKGRVPHHRLPWQECI